MALSSSGAPNVLPMTSDRHRLLKIISEKSLIQGSEIELASGAISSFYFNMKLTTLDPEGASLISKLILDRLKTENVGCVGGLELGAVPIISCVCLASLESNPLPGFIVRKKAKSHGTKCLIEGFTSLRDCGVVMLDDVTTSGGSVRQAIDAVRDEGGKVETVITVVDRLEGARENLEKDGVNLVALFDASDFDL